MTPLDFRNTNTLWCSVLVETLVRGGVTQAVVSPGSRSTPLTMALVRHPAIEAVPVLDERSAAFFALGLAKQSLRPVVLVCTSGSAGAHYLPALIEAQESAIPLIAITADRPPELRDCGANQAIPQANLLAGATRWSADLPCPTTDVPAEFVLSTVDEAFARWSSTSASRRLTYVGNPTKQCPESTPMAKSISFVLLLLSKPKRCMPESQPTARTHMHAHVHRRTTAHMRAWNNAPQHFPCTCNLCARPRAKAITFAPHTACYCRTCAQTCKPTCSTESTTHALRNSVAPRSTAARRNAQTSAFIAPERSWLCKTKRSASKAFRIARVALSNTP